MFEIGSRFPVNLDGMCGHLIVVSFHDGAHTIFVPHRASNIDLIVQQISWLMDGVMEHIAMEMDTHILKHLNFSSRG